MRRREFIVGLGSTAAWPVATQAQQPALPVIGYIGPSPDLKSRNNAAFFRGLNEAGYADGRNVTIAYRWVEGHNDRLPGFVSELVSRRVAVIAVVDSTAAVLAAKAATQTIPIVFRIGGDPIANGLVASLNRPGGNITGTTTLGVQLGAKRLELLRELLPPGAAVVLIANPTNANSVRETEEIQAAARVLGLRLLILKVSSPNDIEAAFASIARQDIGGVMNADDPLLGQERDRIVALVARLAVPAIYSNRGFFEAGGLMSYGTDMPEGFRQAGVYTGRILKGEKPADLPVQQSTRVELTLNLKTAKALGITFPTALLTRADEVIE